MERGTPVFHHRYEGCCSQRDRGKAVWTSTSHGVWHARWTPRRECGNHHLAVSSWNEWGKRSELHPNAVLRRLIGNITGCLFVHPHLINVTGVICNAELVVQVLKFLFSFLLDLCCYGLMFYYLLFFTDWKFEKSLEKQGINLLSKWQKLRETELALLFFPPHSSGCFESRARVGRKEAHINCAHKYANKAILQPYKKIRHLSICNTSMVVTAFQPKQGGTISLGRLVSLYANMEEGVRHRKRESSCPQTCIHVPLSRPFPSL